MPPIEVWGASPDPLDDARWQRLLARHPFARAIAPRWEELAGWKTWGLGRYEAGELAQGVLLSVRRIPGLPVSLGRVTCALFGASRPADQLGRLLDEIDRFSVEHRIVETELRLRVPAGGEAEPWAHLRGLSAAIEAKGYRTLAKTERTYVVDLERSDEELLASFESRTRSSIKKAMREGGRVTISRDPHLLPELYAAIEEMRDRKNAPIPPRNFVEGLAPLLERGQVLVFVERYDELVSNIVVVDVLGLPCYVLGTRTRAHVEGRVPGAGQLVQYEIMRFLRDRGAKHYDLGGCEGPTPVEGHPNFGVWRFKYRFRGRYVTFLPHFRKTRGEVARWLLALGHRVRGDEV